MWNPFFLVTLTGMAVTPVIVCLTRRFQSAPASFASRRRCRLGVPVGLTTALVLLIPAYGGPGGSFVLAHPTQVVVVAGIAAIVVSLYVLFPGWGRLVLLIGVAVIVAPAGALWSPPVGAGLFPFREPHLHVEGLGPGGHEDEARDTVHAGTYTVTIVRVGPGDADLLDVTVVPTTGGLGPIPHTSESYSNEPPLRGAWLPAGSVSSRDRLEISVDVLVTPPFLWWFPPSGAPLALRINGRPVLDRFRDGSLKEFLLETLTANGVLSVRTISVSFPQEGYPFLQPGTYVVEIRPGSLI